MMDGEIMNENTSEISNIPDVTDVTTVNTDIKKFTAFSILKSDEDRQKATELATKFVLTETSILNFGASVQIQVSDLTKPILEKVKARDLNPGRATMNDFVKNLQNIDFNVPLKNPSLLSKVIKALDPWIAWLRSLESVEKMLDLMENKLRDTSNKMLERITWFMHLKDKLNQAVPGLYLYGAACEKIVEREAINLQEMENKLNSTEIADPQFKFLVEEQRTALTRLRTRVLDLHEAAMTAILMIPIMNQSIRSAEIINDSVIKSIRQTMPKIRLTLASLIGQRDIQDAAKASDSIEDADLAITRKLGESLGQTNEAVQKTLDKRIEKVESLKALVNDIKAQMQKAIEIDNKLSEQYDATLIAYGQISESIKNTSPTM
jgi:uncharacterized protein YaaN involved in tellurite resistance